MNLPLPVQHMPRHLASNLLLMEMLESLPKASVENLLQDPTRARRTTQQAKREMMNSNRGTFSCTIHAATVAGNRCSHPFVIMESKRNMSSQNKGRTMDKMEGLCLFVPEINATMTVNRHP